MIYARLDQTTYGVSTLSNALIFDSDGSLLCTCSSE